MTPSGAGLVCVFEGVSLRQEVAAGDDDNGCGNHDIQVSEYNSERGLKVNVCCPQCEI